MRPITLICFPFAGGNRYSFRAFQSLWPKEIRTIVIEYPGRGARIMQPLQSDISNVAIDAFSLIKEIIGNTDYAIYGHSMGAIVGFEVIHRILDDGLPAPVHFFVTGTTAPSSPRRSERKWHLLPKDQFISRLRDLDGCPKEIFENPELLDFVEPIIRSDFKAVETFRYHRRKPFDIPVTVVTGSEESMEERDIVLWQEETVRKVDFRRMKGDHFFIFDMQQNDIPRLILEKIYSS